jgi:hypothetical protein
MSGCEDGEGNRWCIVWEEWGMNGRGEGKGNGGGSIHQI